MIRIHFTAADLARVRFATRPAPLQELNSALFMMLMPRDELIFGRWRRRLMRSLPSAVLPLRDLVPAWEAPEFIDVVSGTLKEGFELERASDPDFVRSELERVYAATPRVAPAWIHDLCRGKAEAWHTLHHAQHVAFNTVVGPVWSVVQDLHHAEFTRHAMTAATGGIGVALADAVPGSRLREGVWEFAGPAERDVKLAGRGLLLLPTFHWNGWPLISDLDDQPVVVTYPAGPGLPLIPEGADGTDDALASVLGRSRFEILLLLAEDAYTTGGLARRLGLSNATVSAHTAALRGAGLITTVRTGQAVLHQRTTLGDLLMDRRGGSRQAVPG